MSSLRGFYLVFSLFIFLSFSTIAFGLPGALDTTFDYDGITQSALNAASSTYTYCYDYPEDNVGYIQAIQKNDGKIVVASSTTTEDISVQRFLPSGKYDLTFGTSGKVVTNIPSSDSVVTAMAIQSDGKIVVVGLGVNTIHIVRYLATGAKDLSFDGDGIVIKPVGDYHPDYSFPWITSMTIQPNGRYLLGGSIKHNYPGGYSVNQAALYRFNTDGSPDTSFDSDGLAATSYPDQTYARIITAVHYKSSNNRIIATGTKCVFNNAQYPQHLVAQYTSGGSLDTSFGYGGINTTLNGASNSSLLEPDGKIVIAGDQYIERLNTDGRTRDTSFGSAGYIVANTYTTKSIRREAGGRYVVAGIWTASGAEKNPIVQRYNADGTLDTSFGFSGSVITDVGIPMDIVKLTLQSDGKILLGGISNTRFTLFRYLAD